MESIVRELENRLTKEKKTDYNSIDKIRSLQIIIVTTAKNNDSGYKLLTKFGFPFIKEEPKTTEQNTNNTENQE